MELKSVKHVLVVEDDPAWQKLIGDLLQEVADTVGCSLQITVASSFAKALVDIATVPFNCAILDNRLPGGKRAKPLLDRIAALDREVVVVVVSGPVTPSEVGDFFTEYGIRAFCWKHDFSSKKFKQTLQAILANESGAAVHGLTEAIHQRQITWLHLSDLHIGCEKEGRSWKSLKDALLKDIEAHQEPGQPEYCAGIVFKPDLILITGDIAYHGRHDEYEEAERFLKSLWQIIELDEEVGKERTFIVPGNHDLDRKAVENDPTYTSAYKALADNTSGAASWHAALDTWWQHPPLRALWQKKFAEFLRFMNKCTATSADFGYYIQPVHLSGTWLDIIGLNSALMSWKDDEDRERGLWIGKPQLDAIEGSLSDESLRIALVHHPCRISKLVAIVSN